MKLGLSLPVFTADVARPTQAAGRAAAAGFDAVFASDHLFPPGAPGRPALEAFSLLAAAAAAHPGLGVGVLVTRPFVRPVGILAKMAAGLHQISDGRAVVGLGLGDVNGRAEHHAIGVPFPPVRERAAALEETVLALRALFAGRTWEGGEHVPALRGPILPPAAPPVWIGGASDRALSLAARVANGWNGWGLDATRFTARAADLARAAREAGRDPAEVLPTWGGIVLVGRDRAELASLEAERAADGLPMDIWRGTLGDLTSFRDAIAVAGCDWMIMRTAGPADRAEMIAAALGAR